MLMNGLSRQTQLLCPLRRRKQLVRCASKLFMIDPDPVQLSPGGPNLLDDIPLVEDAADPPVLLLSADDTEPNNLSQA